MFRTSPYPSFQLPTSLHITAINGGADATPESRELCVASKIAQLDLGEFEHKQAFSLSGGNKRKLCVAMAMIGEPPVIFLDEPSAGMDPAAKRYMWDVISRVCAERHDSTVILTTHSMEEASALCSRIGIMVDGEMRCLGSEQHLKDRYGRHFQLQVRFRDPEREEVEGIEHKALLPVLQVDTSGGGHGSIAAADLAEAISLLAQGDESENAEKKWEGGECNGEASRSKAERRLSMFGDLNSSEKPSSALDHQNESDSNAHNSLEKKDKTHPSAWLLEHDLEATGRCSAAALARWWLLQNRVDEFEAWLLATFGLGCAMVEAHGTILRYRIPRKCGHSDDHIGGDGIGSGLEKRELVGVGLAFMFKAIEDSRRRLHIADYSLSQTTLEQIFIGFAKRQRDDAIARGFARPEDEDGNEE